MKLAGKKTDFLPGLFVARRESRMDPAFFAHHIAVADAPIVENPQSAPDPVRYSEFSGVGRAPGQRWASVPVAPTDLNIAAIQAVMQDTFMMGKVIPQRLTLMRNGYGGQLAWQERQNIDRGQAAPYGNRVAVESPTVPTPGIDGYGIGYTDTRRY